MNERNVVVKMFIGSVQSAFNVHNDQSLRQLHTAQVQRLTNSI